jgi:hypothetical protein
MRWRSGFTCAFRSAQFRCSYADYSDWIGLRIVKQDSTAQGEEIIATVETRVSEKLIRVSPVSASFSEDRTVRSRRIWGSKHTQREPLGPDRRWPALIRHLFVLARESMRMPDKIGHPSATALFPEAHAKRSSHSNRSGLLHDFNRFSG